MAYSNSPLVACKRISPNRYVNRKHAIDRITPHCIVGQWDVTKIGDEFARESKGASCNYGIAKDGRVVLVVEEKDGSWCSSSESNDRRAVTIECASEATHPYAFNNAVYGRLIELCADICRRNGKSKLLWLGSKTKALNYKPKADEMVLTVHRWFSNKACPGDWLYNRLGDLAARVNNLLKNDVKEEDDEVVETIKITVNGKEIKADAIVKDGRTFLNLRSLENAGFKVGYDNATKMRVLDNSVKSLPVVVSGKETVVPAVNINGYNYLTIRTMADLVGLNTEYDADKDTVVLKTAEK